MISDRPPLLEARRIRKRFPGVLALEDVDLTLKRSEVVAVIGENGAGKSTLMEILGGVETPDAGGIFIEGQAQAIESVRAAQRFGIALIHQELNLADNLDVAANLYLGREPGRFGFINRRRLYQEAARLLDRVEFDIPPRRLVRDLSIGRQQLVEIAKALSANARILIMDEPTSSLSQAETQRLFQVIHDLRGQGVSVIYISHRLGEVKQVADRVVALRDGRNAGQLEREAISHEAMVRLMVGRELSQFFPHQPLPPGKTVLEVRNLVTGAYPRHAVDLTLRAGEIVGVAGLIGAGRSELVNALFGVGPAVKGRICVGGRALPLRSPGAAIQAGMALVPEDRKTQGLILEMTARENLSLAALWRLHRFGVLDRSGERAIGREMIRKLSIKTPSEEQAAQFLSGGNQQKVVLGKWLALRPSVLLLDEPTRGIDVGAKREVYGLMDELARDGVAILFVSSELEEVMGMSDRLVVMHEGRIAGELARGEFSEEAIMRLATGQQPAGLEAA